MSLVVGAYRIDANGESSRWIDAPLPSPRSDAFGFEVCRHRLWGAPVVRELGCRLLASLGDGDIHAEGEALDQLEDEARRVIANLADIEESTGYTAGLVQARIDNLLAVLAYARSESAGTVGVYIG